MSRYYTNISQKPTVDRILSIEEKYMATGKEVVEYETAGWKNSVPTTSSTNCYLWNYKRIVYADGTSEKTKPTIIWNAKTNGNVSSLTTYYLAYGSSGDTNYSRKQTETTTLFPLIYMKHTGPLVMK